MYGGPEIFDGRTAEFYLWLLDRLGLLRWAYAMARNIIVENVKPPAKVLEIGSGTGRLAHMLSGRGFYVVGIDISLPMVKRAVRFREPDFINGASWRLPTRDGYFDVIVTQFTLHHWGDHEGSIRMVNRVLRRNGLFIVIEADGDRVPVFHEHTCGVECLLKAIPANLFSVEVFRRFPLVVALARKVN